MSDHLYNDEEVSQILRLALEPGDDPVDHKHGVSLDELVKVAHEAGIPEDRIRRAAEKMVHIDTGHEGVDWSGCKKPTVFEVLADRELTEDDWTEVVTELRHTFNGTTGKVGGIGKSKEWSSGSDLGPTLFTLTPSEGKTKIKATLDASRVALFSYCLYGLIAAALFFVVGTPILVKKAGVDVGTALLIFGSAWLGIMGIVRWQLGRWYKKTSGSVRMVIDRITGLLEKERTLEQNLSEASSTTLEAEEVLEESH